MKDFKKLASIPIMVYYGDNIATKPTDRYGMDQWRAELQLTGSFADAVNRHGGDATVMHLYASAGNRHHRQYAFPVPGSRQHSNSEWVVGISRIEGS